MESDNGLPLTHFVRHILSRTFGDTRTTGFGRFGHFITNSLCKLSMLLRCHHYIKIINCHFKQ